MIRLTDFIRRSIIISEKSGTGKTGAAKNSPTGRRWRANYLCGSVEAIQISTGSFLKTEKLSLDGNFVQLVDRIRESESLHDELAAHLRQYGTHNKFNTSIKKFRPPSKNGLLISNKIVSISASITQSRNLEDQLSMLRFSSLLTINFFHEEDSSFMAPSSLR